MGKRKEAVELMNVCFKSYRGTGRTKGRILCIVRCAIRLKSGSALDNKHKKNLVSSITSRSSKSHRSSDRKV